MYLKQNVGIDLSMESFEVNFSALDYNFEKHCLGTTKFINENKGFNKLIAWVDKHCTPDIDVSFTIEFTGVYYERLAYFLKENNKVVHMVIPSKSKKYCQSLSIASKTDKLDARALSWMGLERKLPEWNPISTLFLSMRTLTREREELLKERTITLNRIHSLGFKEKSSKSTLERLEARLKLINEHIEEVEKEIYEIIKSDDNLHKNFQRVTTIPGVAFVTLATILAETDGFAAIKNQKQLTSYAGYDVKLMESGKYKGKSKISKQGNAHIRRVLHFPALTAIRYNISLSVFYGRVNDKKSKPMIAGVAVQRKLLCLIYAIWKSGDVYDPKYEANKQKSRMTIESSYSG